MKCPKVRILFCHCMWLSTLSSCSARVCGHTMKTLSDTVTRSCSHSHGWPDAATVAREGNLTVARCYFVCHLCVCVFVYTPKQVAEDMEAMKRRHQLMVQELEENFQITAQKNQVWKCLWVSGWINGWMALKLNGLDVVLLGMHHAEDQISLPEQVEHSAENPRPLSRKGGKEKCWLEEESCGQCCSLASPSLCWVSILFFIQSSLNSTYSSVPLLARCRSWLHRMSNCWQSRQLRGEGVKRRPHSGTEKRLDRKLILWVITIFQYILYHYTITRPTLFLLFF